MADWYGVPFFRLLFIADRFSDRAIFSGSSYLNTPCFRSSASLVSVTPADHFLMLFLLVFLLGLGLAIAFSNALQKNNTNSLFIIQTFSWCNICMLVICKAFYNICI